MAAKRAALDGYDTSIVSGASTDLYRQLLYDLGSDELPNLALLESITGDDEEAFDELLRTADGLIVSIDGDDPISCGLLDVVMPATSAVKRVACMTRNLNGKGLGPFVAASKGAANKEVWSPNGELVNEYQRMEAKAKELCLLRGADCQLVRVGTLKGGGPGSDAPLEPDVVKYGLTAAFYGLGQQDLVNWRMLFDTNCQGLVLKKGDVVEGPGFGGVFAATAVKAAKGDTARHAVAAALVKALGASCPANADFAVTSTESRQPPTPAEWDAQLSQMA